MPSITDWSSFQFTLPSAPQAYPIDQALSDDLTEYRQPSAIAGAAALQAMGQQACIPIFEAIRPSLRARTTDLQLAASQNAQIVQYRNIVSHLDALQEDYTNLLRNCWLKVAFADAISSDELTRERAREDQERWIQEGLEHRAFQPSTFRSIVTARFVSDNDRNMLPALVDDTQRLAREFVRVCVQQLLDLVGEMAVGVAQWYPGNNCRYIFFRRQVTSKYEERVRTIGRAGVTLDAIECHDHHLIKAYSCDPANSPVPIPKPVAELIATIPDWLRPQVRLIVGTLVQETVSQRVVSTDQWLELPSLQINGGLPFDPGLAIGSFVLTGWSPTDPITHRAGQTPFAGGDPASEQWDSEVTPKWSRLMGG